MEHRSRVGLQLQSGEGMVHTDYSSHQKASSLSPTVQRGQDGLVRNPALDMTDNYRTGVDFTRVSSSDYSGPGQRRKHSFTGSSKANHETSFQGPTKTKTEHEKGMVDMYAHDFSMEALPSSLPEVPSEIPGLSIITWEEFIEDPRLLHDLFTIDKQEFIHFDGNIVSNFFHDSRMDPPTLGGPSGDGLSWTIFIDSYTQLRQVRDIMTSRISVLLLDLVKPNNQGTASCLVAINPNDDHIRRVLHLTLSRAMESLLAHRCFCIEINLNNSVNEWCKSVLQIECNVVGGSLVITNGDANIPCCEVEDRKWCILCFPLWAFRKIRYLIKRRNRYDDTKVEFESSSLVLCTKSDKLRQYSEAAQLTNGERIIMKNKNSVTMATQTLHASTTSLQSDMSVEEVEEAADNDVMQRRSTPHDERGDKHQALNGHDIVTNDEREDLEITYSTRHPTLDRSKSRHGVTNAAFQADENDNHEGKTKSGVLNIPKNTSNKNPSKKTKSVAFQQAMEINYTTTESGSNSELDVVAKANLYPESAKVSSKKAAPPPPNNGMYGEKSVNFFSSDTNGEELPSPRSAFLARPDTPFQRQTKPRKVTPVSKLDTQSSSNALLLDNNNSPAVTPRQSDDKQNNNGEIYNKITKRQKKIGLLLKDLVLSSTTGTKSKLSSDSLNDNEGFDYNDIDDRKDERKGAFLNSNLKLDKTPKVKQTPVKGWNSETDKVFPYTSDLLSFPAMSPNVTEDALEKYGAKKKKKEKHKQKSLKRTDDMLFRPRLNIDDIGPDRNCFSDQDVADSDITDLETEAENAVSDTEGITSSRLIPVKNTTRTISLDSVNKSDVDTDLEIADCEAEEDELAKRLRGPRILPGAMAAHEMRASSAGKGRATSAGSRDYIPPSAQVKSRRGGSQYDSRRRYLALNSLRRKAYKLALQSQIRSQRRPLSAQLISFNKNDELPKGSNVAAIISQV